MSRTGRRPRSRPRIGLALAGGGPLGAVWEIGALCALQEAVPALDLNALDGYVGVSAGSFVAAGLANGMTPRQLATSFIENAGPRRDIVSPSLFIRPALGEYARRLAQLPGLLLQAAWVAGAAVAHTAAGERRSLLPALERVGRALPAGLFSHAALGQALQRVFSAPGRSNSFGELRRRRGSRLVLVATDLDSGEAAPFGLPGWDDVPISQAVVASAALPGLFPPVALNGRWYVDGALKKTLHARVLLDQGVDLLLCLNPLVPFEAGEAPQRVGAGGRIPRLVDGGLPVVLSQTFRSLIHSRLELGLHGYQASHPGTDIVLLEPDQRDAEIFLANVFGYAQRRSLAEHAYRHTRADLRSRRSQLGGVLASHGLALDHAVLDDPARTLLRQPRPAAAAAPPARQVLVRLDEVLCDLERTLALR